MQWLQLLSAFGIGALCIKLMDILWLQRITQRHEHCTWLRNKRLEAYTNLSKIIISFGLNEAYVNNPFSQFATASEAMLLTYNDALIDRIDKFIVRLDHFHRLSEEAINDEDKRSVENLYNELTKEARLLLKELRNNLIVEENQQVNIFSKIHSKFRKNS